MDHGAAELQEERMLTSNQCPQATMRVGLGSRIHSPEHVAHPLLGLPYFEATAMTGQN